MLFFWPAFLYLYRHYWCGHHVSHPSRALFNQLMSRILREFSHAPWIPFPLAYSSDGSSSPRSPASSPVLCVHSSSSVVRRVTITHAAPPLSLEWAPSLSTQASGDKAPLSSLPSRAAPPFSLSSLRISRSPQSLSPTFTYIYSNGTYQADSTQVHWGKHCLTCFVASLSWVSLASSYIYSNGTYQADSMQVHRVSIVFVAGSSRCSFFSYLAFTYTQMPRTKQTARKSTGGKHRLRCLSDLVLIVVCIFR